MLRRLLLFLSAGAVPALILCCASTDTSSPSPMTQSEAGLADRGRLDGQVKLNAPCLVTLETPEVLLGTHVTEGTTVQYNSNPPTSGPHYPVWAAFQEYDKPIDRRYLVHDMEHGAVVIFYKCADQASCAPLLAAAREAVAALPDDKSCSGTGARVRVIIVPDPAIDVPLAAASWGWLYKAACGDANTLKQFVRDHYAQGTEDTCAPGQATF